MPRPGRRVLRFLLLVAVLAAAAIAVAPFVPLDALKPTVESRLSAALGRPTQVGSVRLSLMGGPYLVLRGMTAKEDPAFGEGNFLEADQVRANLALLPFALRREVIIEALDLESPQFTFVKKGAWSWTTIGPARQEASRLPGGFARPAILHLIATDPSIHAVSMGGATVRLIDPSNATSPESLYKSVTLRADITRQPSGPGSRLVGELRAESDPAEGAELLRANIGFDLVVDRGPAGYLMVSGLLGPGRLETNSLAADSFKSSLDYKENRLVLDQMDLSLYEGSLAGRMDLDLKSQRFAAEGRVTNLNLDQAFGAKLQIPGQITGHIDADFKLDGVLRSFQETVPTVNGSGRLSSSDLFIASVNLSEQVARALRLNEIGDMSAGTRVGSLQSDFQVLQGQVMTTNLSLGELDGLGDAKSDQGWFRMSSTPTLDYMATVLLTPDATARVKSASPLLGFAITILEDRNRVAVPVNIRGDVRDPVVQVDVSRIFR